MLPGGEARVVVSRTQEASKGKIFLIYDLEVKLKWEASDGEGGEACKGSMKLPDVSRPSAPRVPRPRLCSGPSAGPSALALLSVA